MLSEFTDFILREDLFSRDDRILLAVSGGMDSVALAELFHRSGFDFGIAHCNFSLRGLESDGDEKFVRDLSIRYGVYYHVERFDTQAYADENKLSVQMAARELRYAWFKELLAEFGYRYVATGHHRDDQVESFMINLSRGTGIAGLHGILPKKNEVIRPLLFATREGINQFVQAENLAYREDSSNAENKYLRNRIRNRVIPELEKATPDFQDQVMKTIENIRQVEEIYRQTVDAKRKQFVRITGDDARISINALNSLNPLRTWTFEFLKPYGFNSSTAEMVADSMDKEAGKTFLSSTHRLVVDRMDLIITPFRDSQAEEGPVVIPSPEHDLKEPLFLSLSVITPEEVVFSDDQNTAFLDLDKLEFPLEIRKWQQGDYFFPLGMRQRKKLSDYFIDQKIPIPEKERIWLLSSKGSIAWIIGQRIDERFKVHPGTSRVLRIEYSQF